MSEKEEWKTLKYYCDKEKKMLEFPYHLINQNGLVKRVGSENPLKIWDAKNGFKFVSLTDNKHTKKCAVHRAVISTFTGMPTEENMTVAHVDEHRTNNNFMNLKWQSKSQQKRSKKDTGDSSKSIPIEKVSETGEVIAEYLGFGSVPGIPRTSVARYVQTGLLHNGYQWRVKCIKEIDNEQWKNWYGTTDISNMGRIRRLHKSGIYYEVVNRHPTQCGGYYIIPDNQGKNVSLHRAVASLFLGLDLSDQQSVINHINENKLDNRVANLEITTTKENVLHSRGFVYGVTRQGSKNVIECESYSQIAEVTGMNLSQIYQCISNNISTKWTIFKIERIATKRMRQLTE